MTLLPSRRRQPLGSQAWVLLVVMGILAPLSTHADLENAVKTIREDHFKETSPGVPGISVDRVDEDFVRKLYTSDLKAMEALGKILATDNYRQLNMKIGEIRNRINLEVWSEIVAEYGIRIELNNAGKMNGAISDLDQTLFTDAEEVVSKSGRKITGSREVHNHLTQEFENRFRSRMDIALSPADAYDMMHFPGDGMMADWRMSDRRSAAFLVELDDAISELTKMSGAYFIPGAYKTQVYTRYLAEGRTIVIDASIPEQGGTKVLPGYGEIEVPPGVKIEMGPTRQLSKLYENVPSTHDRTGALGALVENAFHADHVTNVVKQTKYGNRIPDTSLVALTNLEVDFRHLLLEGRDGARKHFVNKLFRDAKNNLPANLESLAEIQRLFELQQRIELDKVLRNIPKDQRPKSWTSEWRNYEPQDVNDVDTKLKYFAQEVAELKAELDQFEEGGLDMNDPETKQQMAELAERTFFQKIKSINKLGAAQAAQKVFRDVFTRQGYSRLKHIHGKQRARNLLIERVRELHAMLVMTDDPELLKTVMDQAPAETKSALQNLVDIAKSQRTEIAQRRGAVSYLEAEDLKASNQVLRDLLRRLNLSDFDPNLRAGEGGGHAGTRSLRSFADGSWLDRHVSILLNEEIINTYRNGDTIKSLSVGKVVTDPKGSVKNVVLETYAYNADRARTFFNTTLPAFTDSGLGSQLQLFSSEYAKGFLDLGTVDSAAKMASAWAKKDKDTVRRESLDLIFGGAPQLGPWYNLAKNLKDYEKGKTMPLYLFLAQRGFGFFPHYGGPASKLLGNVAVAYSLYNTYVDFQWHFYGHPSQLGGISYILTGKHDAVPTVGWGSKFMNFTGSPTETILKGNAILDRYVPIPDLPKEYREAVLRNLFRTQANQAAWDQAKDADIFQRGEGSSWHAARENVLQTNYFKHWRYWFQRIWFYHYVYPQVYQAMQSQPLDVWAGFNQNPPPEIASLPVTEQLAKYGDAFDPASKYWDYEKYYTRKFFENWVTEWEKGMDTSDVHARRFYTALEDRGGSNWQKAVVDELMRYYLEGEALFSAQPQRPEGPKPQLDGTQQQAMADYEAGLQKLPRRTAEGILLETRGKGRGMIEQIEGLYWHPTVLEKLEAAFLRSAEGQPDYQPKEPKLNFKIPNPVVRSSRSIRLDASVQGDTKELPDDIQFKVEYRKVAEHKGKRPDAVLLDDVRLAFGTELNDEDLMVVEHEATLTAFSPSDSSFKLSEKRPVYWLDRNPDDEATTTSELGDEPEDQEPGNPGLVEEGRGVANQAVTAAEDAENACRKARAAANRAEDIANNVAELLSQAERDIQSLKSQLEKLRSTGQELEQIRNTVNASAQTLAQVRDPLGQAALNTCEFTRQLKDATTQKARNSLMDQIKTSFGEATQLYNEAKAAYDKLRAERKKAEALVPLLETARQTVARLDQLFPAIADGLAKFEHHLVNARRHSARVTEAMDRAEQLRSQSAALVAASPAGDTRTELEAQLGRITRALSGPKDCTTHLADQLGKLDDRLAKMREKETKLRSDFEELRVDLVKLEKQTFEATIQDLIATADAADLLWTSIEDYYAKAKHCMSLAEGIFSQPITVPVPNVLGLTAKEAQTALAKAQLTMSPVGGSMAPKPELSHTVAEQSPAAGSRLELGKPVNVLIYSQATVATPKIVGLTVEQAQALLIERGLQGRFNKSKPAPSPKESRKIISQKPPAGATLAPGSTVIGVFHPTYVDRNLSVPAVVGYPSSEAQEMLYVAGLKNSVTKGDPAPTPEQTNVVYAQNLAPGSRVPPKSFVHLTVYGDYVPAKITVPSVLGLGGKQATALLEKTGLAANIKRDAKTAPRMDQEGFAYSQSPPAGDQVEPGSTVMVSLYGPAKRPSTKVTPQPKPRPTPDREAKEFFVIFDAYSVQNLGEALGFRERPSDRGTYMRSADTVLAESVQNENGTLNWSKYRSLRNRVERTPASAFQIGKSESEQHVGIRVSGPGLEYYRIEDFTVGKKFATPLKLNGRQKGKQFKIEGSMLLKTIESFDQPEAFYRRFPKANFTGVYRDGDENKSKIFPLNLNQRDGRFAQKVQDKDNRFTIAGGPLKAGWTNDSKRANALLTYDMLTQCSAESAFYHHPDRGVRQIATLRRFRDDILQSSSWGRRLTAFYYDHASPQALRIMQEKPESRAFLTASFTLFATGYELLERAAHLDTGDNRALATHQP